MVKIWGVMKIHIHKRGYKSCFDGMLQSSYRGQFSALVSGLNRLIMSAEVPLGVILDQ
jgi:hypothetical protein